MSSNGSVFVSSPATLSEETTWPLRSDVFAEDLDLGSEAPSDKGAWEADAGESSWYAEDSPRVWASYVGDVDPVGEAYLDEADWATEYPADEWSEDTDDFASAEEAFPSGLELSAVPGLTGHEEEHWDPHNTGLPLYDTGSAVRGKKLSRSFTVGELASSGGRVDDHARISLALVQCLQAIRDRAGRTVKVTSGYRSWNRNVEVYRRLGKTATRSRHCSGQAADITIAGLSGMQIAKLAVDSCGDRIGIGVGKTFAHIDVRGTWAVWTYEGVDAIQTRQLLENWRNDRQLYPLEDAASPFHTEAATTERLLSPRFVGDRLLEACLQDRARLRAGNSGPSVVKVQRALIDLGYDIGRGGADGIYGPATEQAVRSFKRNERLGFEQYGDVGPGTMKRLDQIFRDDHRTSDSMPALVAGSVAEADPDLRIELPLAPASALTIPPEEGDCPPIVAEIWSDEGEVPPGAPVTPCELTPAPPGSLSEFEIDLRSNPDRIRGVVVDPETQEIIGYRAYTSGDVLQVVDREGNFVEGAEKGLESPPVDPIDFIPSPRTAVKGAVIIGKAGLKALGVFTAKGGAAKGWKVSMAVIPRLQKLSKTLNRRGVRAAKRISKMPARQLTLAEAGINHTWEHGASKPTQWFGGTVTRATHDRPWRELINRAHNMGGDLFPWSVGETDTIAKLVFIDGKHFVLQYSEATGALITAFKPGMTQLVQFKRVLGLMR